MKTPRTSVQKNREKSSDEADFLIFGGILDFGDYVPGWKSSNGFCSFDNQKMIVVVKLEMPSMIPQVQLVVGGCAWKCASLFNDLLPSVQARVKI